MVRFTGGLLLFSAFSLAAPADRASSALSVQQVIAPQANIELASPRKLQGRFLHITGTTTLPCWSYSPTALQPR
jgi:hypothetical protein